MQRGNLIVLGLVFALAACSPPPTAPPTTPTSAGVETAATSAPAPQNAIPEAFWGRWDTSVERCHSTTSDTHMTIAADEITYFESGGHVTKVDITGPHDINVTTAMSGEGETWDKTTRMTLSDDAATLTVDENARVRCN